MSGLQSVQIRDLRPIRVLLFNPLQCIMSNPSLSYNISIEKDADLSVDIRRYSSADSAGWDNYLRSLPSSTFCHLSGWMRVIDKVWRHRSYSLIAERNGAVVGVMPLFKVSSRLFGSMLVSTPNAVYGGPIADDFATRRRLIAEAKGLAAQLGVDYLELRYSGLPAGEDNDAELLPQNLYVTFDHAITTDEDSLMKSFPRDIRRMIRLGPKNGLQSEIGREDLLDDFYQVYATSVRNLGTPVFPRRLFREFLDEFDKECDILIIRQGRRVAGAVMNFYFRDSVLPYYGGAYPDFNRAGVNNFMYWELMRRAAARGFTRFDFGRSKLGTGSYEFKRGWGMTERALPYRFFLARAEKVPNLNPTNPKFKFMIDVWKRLPLGLTKLIGPMIVKNLP